MSNIRVLSADAKAIRAAREANPKLPICALATRLGMHRQLVEIAMATDAAPAR